MAENDPEEFVTAQNEGENETGGGNEMIIEVEPGRTIIEQGITGRGFYILQSGTLEVFKDNVKLAVLMHPGTVFGEMSDILGRPRTCTIRAKTKVEVLHIGSENMEETLASNPAIAIKIIKTLAARLERTTQKLADASKESPVWSISPDDPDPGREPAGEREAAKPPENRPG